MADVTPRPEAPATPRSQPQAGVGHPAVPAARRGRVRASSVSQSTAVRPAGEPTTGKGAASSRGRARSAWSAARTRMRNWPTLAFAVSRPPRRPDSCRHVGPDWPPAGRYPAASCAGVEHVHVDAQAVRPDPRRGATAGLAGRDEVAADHRLRALRWRPAQRIICEVPRTGTAPAAPGLRREVQRRERRRQPAGTGRDRGGVVGRRARAAAGRHGDPGGDLPRRASCERRPRAARSRAKARTTAAAASARMHSRSGTMPPTPAGAARTARAAGTKAASGFRR